MIKKIKATFKEFKWYEWLMILTMFFVADITLIQSILGYSSTPIWLSIVNYISAICGIFCIFFVQKAGIANYAFAIVNTITYAIFLLSSEIYGTFCLELFVYLPMNFVGLYVWLKHKDDKHDHITKVKSLNWWKILLSIIGICICFSITFLITKDREKSVLIAIIDSSIVGVGLVATMLQTLRYREHYWLWIINDITSIILYIVSFNPLYLVKKTIYLISAIIGIIYWYKLNKERNLTNE